MKLRLPQALAAAILACYSIDTTVAVDVYSGVNLATLVANGDGQALGKSYTVSNGLVTFSGMSTSAAAGVLKTSRFVFDLNMTAMKAHTGTAANDKEHVVYVYKRNNNSDYYWGFYVNGAGEDSYLVGNWQNNEWSTNDKVTYSTLKNGETGEVASVTLSGDIEGNNGMGTGLGMGYTAPTSTSNLYWKTNLKTAAEPTAITFNSKYVNNIFSQGLHESGTVLRLFNATGDWAKEYDTATNYVVYANTTDMPTEQKDNTLVLGGALTVNSSSNTALLANSTGAIVVASAGQLAITGNANTNAVSLGKNIILGGSTHANAAAQGVLYLNNNVGNAAANGGISLSGTVTLIENSSIGVASSSRKQAVVGTVDVGSYTLTKKGAGRLDINHYSQAEDAGGIHVAGGTVMLDSHNIHSVNNVTLDAGTTFAVHTSIGGSYGSDDDALTIGTLTLNGSATLQTCDNSTHRSRILLSNINSTVNGDITLSLYDDHPATGNASAVVFKNGISGTVRGRLDITEAKNGTREFAVILADNDALAGTSVNVKKIVDNGKVIIAVGSDEVSEVQIKGLSSNVAGATDAFGSNTVQKVISYTGTETAGISENTQSQGGHTLVITAAGAESYTFNGDMGDSLGIRMLNDGFQTLKNIGNNSTLDIGSGHLTVNENIGTNASVSIGSGELRVEGDVGTGGAFTLDNGSLYLMGSSAGSTITVNGAGSIFINNGWDINESTHVATFAGIDIIDNSDGAATVEAGLAATGDGTANSFVQVNAAAYSSKALTITSGFVKTDSSWNNIKTLKMYGGNFVSISGARDSFDSTMTLDLQKDTTFRTWGDGVIAYGDGRSHAILTIEGKLKGEGNLIKTDGGTLVFKGDTSEWTGGIVLRDVGDIEVETAMTAASLSIESANAVLRIGKSQSGASLTVNSDVVAGAATQNIELGKGGAMVINGALSFSRSTASEIKIGTINAFTKDAVRSGDYGSVTATALDMGLGGNAHSTLTIGANTALNITGAGSTSLTNDPAAFSAATLYICNWQADSITNIFGTFNALNCEYFSVVDPANSSNTVQWNVENGGVANVKGLILQHRNTLSNAYLNFNLKSGSMLNVGSAGIQQTTVAGNTTNGGNTRKLYLDIAEGATIGILEGTDSWTSNYEFTDHADYDSSFKNTVINTQHYKAATNGEAGSYATTGGTIMLTGAVAGSFTKDGVGTLVLTNDADAAATLKMGVLELAAGKTLTSLITDGAGVELHANGATVGTVTVQAGHDLLQLGALDTSALTLEATGQIKLLTGAGINVAANGTLTLNGTLDLTEYMPNSTDRAISAGENVTTSIGENFRINLNSNVAEVTATGDVNSTGLLDSHSKWYISSGLNIAKSAIYVDGTQVGDTYTWDAATGTLSSGFALYNIAADDSATATDAFGSQGGADRSSVLFQSGATLTGVSNNSIPDLSLVSAAGVTDATIELDGTYTASAASLAQFAGTIKITSGSVLAFAPNAAASSVNPNAVIEFDGGVLCYPSTGDSSGLRSQLTCGAIDDTHYHAAKVDTNGQDVTWTSVPGSELYLTHLADSAKSGSLTLSKDGTNTTKLAKVTVDGGAHLKLYTWATLAERGNLSMTLRNGTLTFTGRHGDFGDNNHDGMYASACSRFTYLFDNLNVDATGAVTIAADSDASVKGNGFGFTNTFTYTGSGKDAVVDITADITAWGTGNAGNRTFNIGENGALADGEAEVTLSGLIGNNNGDDSRNITLVKTGAGTLKIAETAFSYTPGMLVQEGEVIAASTKSIADQRASGMVTTLTVGNGDTVESATFNLQADNRVAKLSGTVKGHIDNSGTDAKTLTINGTGGTFAGSVGAKVNLVMTGSGTMNFTGDVTAFNGDVSVSAGKMAFSNALAAAGTATVTGGTLQLDNGAAFNGITGTGGSITTGADTAKDITIHGAGGTYYGSVGSNLNIVMNSADTETDEGTVVNNQTFNGDLSAFNGNVKVTQGSLTFNNSSDTAATIGTLSIGANAGTTTVGGKVNATTTTMAKSQQLTLSDGGTLTTGILKLEANQGKDATLKAASTSDGGGNVVINSNYVFKDMGVTLTAAGGDTTFFAGLDNADLVHDATGTTKLNLCWRAEKDVRNLEVKQGSLEIFTEKSRDNTINISGTVKLAENTSITLKDAKSIIKTSAFELHKGSSEGDAVITGVGTGGALLAGNGNLLSGSVGQGSSENAPTDLTALMAGCSLQNTDVVIDASGAIDAKAVALGVDDFFGKTFTLNILSGVTLSAGYSFSLALKGMENYSNLQIHWSVAENNLSGDGESLETVATSPDALVAGDTGVIDFINDPIRFATETGAVVDVWATFTVPEPTSGAMNVLALAALAARRRRRK